jgi:Spy/CpxP family protein refolding chaperone
MTEEIMASRNLTRIVGGLGAAAIVAVGLVTVIPYTGAAQDQPQTQGDQTRPGRRGPGGPGGFGGRGRMGGPMAEGPMRGVMRDLTDAQREQVRAIHERHAERIRPLSERVHAAREAIHQAVASGNTGNLQSLSIEVGNAETELAFAQAQVQAEVFGVLTAEQKQKIAEQRKQMEQRRGEMMKRRQNRQ